MIERANNDAVLRGVADKKKSVLVAFGRMPFSAKIKGKTYANHYKRQSAPKLVLVPRVIPPYPEDNQQHARHG